MATVTDSFAVIVKSLNASNLHFILQETPFSIYITIRKKLLEYSNSIKAQAQATQTEDKLNSKINSLETSLRSLNEQNDELANELVRRDTEVKALLAEKAQAEETSKAVTDE